MATLSVPYHLDEYLPEWRAPLPGAPQTLRVDLPEAEQWTRMAHLHEHVARRVELSVRGGAAPTVASGDCMVALGTAAGLHRAGIDFGVLWFDAHGDLQTMDTSTSGYVGGIPLRVLTGYRPHPSMEALGLPVVPEERAVLVDARDLDPPEEEFLRGSALRRISVAEVAPDTLPDGPLLVHVDLDVVDPAELPGLLFPTPGGPGAEELGAALRAVAATGRVAALSLGCTWEPDPDTASAHAREQVLAALAGAEARQSQNT